MHHNWWSWLSQTILTSCHVHRWLRCHWSYFHWYPSQPGPSPLLVHVWRANTGRWWWLTGVLKGKRWHRVHHRCRWHLPIHSRRHCRWVHIFCLIIHRAIPHVEIRRRLDYNRTLRAKCFSYRDAHHRVGEVMVVGGRRCFYVYGKRRRGDAVYLIWYDNRDVGAHWFSFRREVGHPTCDSFPIVFPAKKKKNIDAHLVLNIRRTSVDSHFDHETYVYHEGKTVRKNVGIACFRIFGRNTSISFLRGHVFEDFARSWPEIKKRIKFIWVRNLETRTSSIFMRHCFLVFSSSIFRCSALRKNTNQYV